MPEYPEIMSPRQLAKWLQVSDQHVRHMAQEGKIPGVQIGTLWRFSRPQLLAWLEEQSTPSTPQRREAAQRSTS